MRAYVVKRMLLVIPTLFLVTIIVFLTIRLIPGSVVDIMIEQMLGLSGTGGGVVGSSSRIDREDVERLLGLDVPLHIQYGRWMGLLQTPDQYTGELRYAGILQGNLGESVWQPTTVIDEITRRLPVSMELGILGMVIGLIIAIPIGIWSAIRQDSISDYIGRSIAILFIAVPAFWIGTMIMVYPSIWWNWSPPMKYVGFTEDLMGNLGMNLIPAILLGMVLSGTTMRMTRTMMLEVLRQDYIRTAWAKGLNPSLPLTLQYRG